MPLEFDRYADGIADAVVVLRDNAARAGLRAPVPTCPEWTVQDLVVHQGTVHRWARSCLEGDRVDTEALEREGAAASDVLQWLDDGAQDLLRTLDDAPEDLEAFFFLADPPPPRLGWARRQCHETTIHAVDAMAASLGRPPTPRETWFGPTLAADGLDELLTGFLPRDRTRLRSERPRRVLVRPDDTDRAWVVEVGPDAISTSRTAADAAVDFDTRFSGSAEQLYLGLWNRGDELTEDGAPFLGRWRADQTVRWS